MDNDFTVRVIPIFLRECLPDDTTAGIPAACFFGLLKRNLLLSSGTMCGTGFLMLVNLRSRAKVSRLTVVNTNYDR